MDESQSGSVEPRGITAMIRILTIVCVAALLIAPAAEARSTRSSVKEPSTAALKARQTALNDFNARMSRLDRLMGVPSTTIVRSRSAQAGH